jgi:hypothetical protein
LEQIQLHFHFTFSRDSGEIMSRTDWLRSLAAVALLLVGVLPAPAHAQTQDDPLAAAATNVALGRPVAVSTNGANDGHDHEGQTPADITDGLLTYYPASGNREDGVVGYVNDNYNQLMEVKVVIDLGKLYRISRIRYNMGNVQRSGAWNADTLITPMGSTPTNPGSASQGAWTEHNGSLTASQVEIVLQKTRTSYETDWLFIGEIEVYGVPFNPLHVLGVTPSPDAVDVVLDPSPYITATFDRDLAESSLSPDAVELRDCDNRLLTAEVVAVSKRQIGILPRQPLRPGACYQVILTTKVQDGDGQSLTAAYSWSFDTEDTLVDLVPQRIEINQGVGDPAALLAGRDTTMRVFVENLEAGSWVEADVSLTITPLSGAGAGLPLEPRHAKVTVRKPQYSPADLATGAEAANFYFDACQTATLFAPGVQYQLDVTVDPGNLLTETDETNNTAAPRTVTFTAAKPLKLMIASVTVQGGNQPSPVPALQFLRDLFPIQQCPGTAGLNITWRSRDEPAYFWRAEPRFTQLMWELHDDAAREGIPYVIAYTGGSGSEHGDGVTETGQKLFGQRCNVSFIRTQSLLPYHTETLVAHEFGHLMGLTDKYYGNPGQILCDASAGQTAFDFSNRQSGFTRLDTDDLGDHRSNLMCAFAPLQHLKTGISARAIYWISESDYAAALSKLQGTSRAAGATAGDPAGDLAGDPAGDLAGTEAPAPAAGPVRLASGTIGKAGAGQLDAVFRLPEGTPSESDSSGSYALELLDAGGQVLERLAFEPVFAREGFPPYATDTMAFSFRLPDHEEAAALVLRHGDAVLAERRASPSAPVVQLHSPTGSTPWGDFVQVRWFALDADTASFLLTYRVEYSAAGGPWLTLARNLTTPEYYWDTRQWPGGTEAKLRVLASDGFNTGSAATDQPAELAGKQPAVAISEPAANQRFVAGQPISLRGMGLDPEEGILPEAALSWTAGGATLGSGSSLMVTELAPGAHTIELTARDSSGAAKYATVQITVLADTDRDGMDDAWETAAKLNPRLDDSWSDRDFDYLRNEEEYLWKTAPEQADTDRDGALDGDEVRLGTNPKDPKSKPPLLYVYLPAVLRPAAR